MSRKNKIIPSYIRYFGFNFSFSRFLVFMFYIFMSCNIINPDEKIPSYIRINSFQLQTQPTTQGNNSNQITDVWVYLDGQLNGVYELPISFPTILEGNHQLQIVAGIYNDGIMDLRSGYPFYKAFIKDVNLIEGMEIFLEPVTQYQENVITPFPLLEEFNNTTLKIETTAQSQSDSMIIQYDSTDYIGNYAKYISKPNQITQLEIASIEKYKVNNQNTPIYLELHYRSNMSVEVGIYSHPSPGTVLAILDLTLRPRTTWKKIYINLTEEIRSQSEGSGFKVLFRGTSTGNPDSDGNTEYIALDNIKLVYLE